MMRKKVLIIEDNEDNLLLTKFVLEMYTDWKILATSDASEGINIAKLQQPNVILLDYVMPKMNGLTVCQLLHDNPNTRTISIIFVTAMIDPKTRSFIKNTHAVGVIEKPFDVNTLTDRIQKMCQWKTPSVIKG